MRCLVTSNFVYLIQMYNKKYPQGAALVLMHLTVLSKVGTNAPGLSSKSFYFFKYLNCNKLKGKTAILCFLVLII